MKYDPPAARIERLFDALVEDAAACDRPIGDRARSGTLMQQVTLGLGGHSAGAPILEDGGLVGAGAKIIGGVRIGARVRIGAVVTCDVPAGCLGCGRRVRSVACRPTTPQAKASRRMVTDSRSDDVRYERVRQTLASFPPAKRKVTVSAWVCLRSPRCRVVSNR